MIYLQKSVTFFLWLQVLILHKRHACWKREISQIGSYKRKRIAHNETQWTFFVKLMVLSPVLSWLTSGQVYETSKEDPEIGSVVCNGLAHYSPLFLSWKLLNKVRYKNTGGLQEEERGVVHHVQVEHQQLMSILQLMTTFGQKIAKSAFTGTRFEQLPRHK